MESRKCDDDEEQLFDAVGFCGAVSAALRYIVSMFGTISDWVRNIQAAQGDAVIAHGGSLRVRLVLVPPEERAPILREYVRVASSGRKHFPLPVGAPLAEFAAIAELYPVYRIVIPTAESTPAQQADGISRISLSTVMPRAAIHTPCVSPLRAR